jgi:hypothetical protein
MNKTIAAEDISADEKIPSGASNQSEPRPPERPSHADQQVQQSHTTAAAQRAAPVRRPLFRT